MDWHPYAERFELLQGPEFEALKASIKAGGGPQERITYRTVGGRRQGLDGRNRWRACEDLGIKPPLQEIFGLDTEEKVVDYIDAKNVHRRHLSPEWRAARVAELREEGKSIREIASDLGVSKSAVASDLAKPTVQKRTVEKVKGKDGKMHPARKPREPGIESRGKAKPKTGKPTFDWKGLDGLFGKVVRGITDAAKAYPGEKESPEYKKLDAALADAAPALREWRQRLTKGARR